jgi:hypothetical protein
MVFINMKYIITENRLEKVIQKYLDRYEGQYRIMKRIWVDYNEMMDSYDINLFYDLEESKEEPLFELVLNNQTRELRDELDALFGLKFRFYSHIEQ